MDLQQHAGRVIPCSKCIIHAQHGDLDDVRSRALDRRIQCRALGIFPSNPVRGTKLWQVTTPPKQRLRVPILPGHLNHVIQVALHSTETFEVVLHDSLGLTSADLELLGKAKGGQPVDQAVGQCLHLAAEFRGHFINRDIEDARADVIVQVLPRLICLNQPGILREVRHHAHFNLGVIGGQEGLVTFANEERTADAPPGFGTHGDVLQVGIRGAQAAGGRALLVEGGVNASIVLDGFHQPIDGGLHLLVFPVRHQVREEWVIGLGSQLFQLARSGGITGLGLFGLGQIKVLEKHLLQLLRAGEVQLWIPRDLPRCGNLFL